MLVDATNPLKEVAAERRKKKSNPNYESIIENQSKEEAALFPYGNVAHNLGYPLLSSESLLSLHQQSEELASSEDVHTFEQLRIQEARNSYKRSAFMEEQEALEDLPSHKNYAI